MKLRDYQQLANDKIALNFSNGIRKQLLQLPTGAGKTVAFSGLTNRYVNKMNKSVLICVHRQELLSQTRLTLYNGFNLASEAIISGKKHVPTSKVYVGMVETVFNRIKIRPTWCDNIGLLIVDECHRGEFKKIYEYFPNALIVGCSATPLSGKKSDPMKNYFDEIVVGTQIEELIQMGSLCTNETFSIKGINKKSFKVKGLDYDKQQMGVEFSKNKNLNNTVDAYFKLCRGKKTIVFNANIEHSKLVHEAFLKAGLNSKHLDGSESPDDRKNIMKWFENNEDAVLNNVDIATTGLDVPTIQNVIVNRSTMSLTLWLQMTGRGSRPSSGKEFFRIIDMGGNAVMHGDWRINRNWVHMFHNPHLPSEDKGVAPIKECFECGAILAASTVVCPFCGHVHERIQGYDTIAVEFEMLVGRIDVENIVSQAKLKEQKPFKAFYEILDKTVTTLKYRSSEPLNELESMKAYDVFETKVKEWCKVSGRPFNGWVKTFAKERFLEKTKSLQTI
jgi:superfamily II DNA or RNA helicase